MFGMFGGLGEVNGLGQEGSGGPGVVTGVTPAGSGAFGGFPGIYPAMGPGQSGAAGLLELLKRQGLQPPQAIAWGGPAVFGG
jgi:hypothetical protein